MLLLLHPCSGSVSNSIFHHLSVLNDINWIAFWNVEVHSFHFCGQANFGWRYLKMPQNHLKPPKTKLGDHRISKRLFWEPSQVPWVISDGPRRSNWSPLMWDSMFDHVQPFFKQFGSFWISSPNLVLGGQAWYLSKILNHLIFRQISMSWEYFLDPYSAFLVGVCTVQASTCWRGALASKSFQINNAFQNIFYISLHNTNQFMAKFLEQWRV